MTYFLAKADPKIWTIEHLEHDQMTTWNLVRNPQAVSILRSMLPGDDILIYRTGDKAAIVGLVHVTSEPYVDESEYWIVDIAFTRRFSQPITLRSIKASHLFDDWSLIRQSRLSRNAHSSMV